MKRSAILIFIVGLYSCNSEPDFKNIIPSTVDTFATNFISDIKQGNIDECLSKVIPEMRNQTGRDYLNNSFRNIENLRIDSSRIVNARKQIFFGESGFTNYTIDYEYFIQKKYLYFTFNIREQKNNLIITGFDGRFLESSLTDINSFNFGKKGFIHYIILACAILIPLFVLVTLVFVVKTPLPKKWFWIIGVLIGFTKVTFTWTTGQIGFQLISFQILGSGILKSGAVGPWIISFSFPAIAIYFWLKTYLDAKDRELLARHAAEVQKRGELNVINNNNPDNSNKQTSTT
jgi:hypothetical protein